MGTVVDFNQYRRKRECLVIYNFDGGAKIRLTIEDVETNEILLEESFEDIPTTGEQRALVAHFLRSHPNCFVNNA